MIKSSPSGSQRVPSLKYQVSVKLTQHVRSARKCRCGFVLLASDGKVVGLEVSMIWDRSTARHLWSRKFDDLAETALRERIFGELSDTERPFINIKM